MRHLTIQLTSAPRFFLKNINSKHFSSYEIFVLSKLFADIKMYQKTFYEFIKKKLHPVNFSFLHHPFHTDLIEVLK